MGYNAQSGNRVDAEKVLWVERLEVPLEASQEQRMGSTEGTSLQEMDSLPQILFYTKFLRLQSVPELLGTVEQSRGCIRTHNVKKLSLFCT